MQGVVVGILILVMGVGVLWVASHNAAKEGVTDQPTYFKISLPWLNSRSTSSKDKIVNVERQAPILPVGGKGEPPKQEQKPAAPPIVPPYGFTVDQLSPYFRKVKIGGIRPAVEIGYSDSGFDLFTEGLTPEERINITGWYLQSNKGKMDIPQVVNDVNPYLFSNSDLVVGQGARVLFFTSPSPIGSSIRLNKCTGYLNNRNFFNPGLPNECPYEVDPKEMILLSGACQSLVYSMGGCREPSARDMNSVPNEPKCHALLNRFSFGNCYEKHKLEVDFFRNEWRIWLGRDLPFDPRHDRILFFDKQGLLVDERTY